jgi:hypothetical protein
MNYRYIILTFFAFFAFQNIQAEFINQKTAEKVARNFYWERVNSIRPTDLQSIKTESVISISKDNKVVIYHVNFKNEGFVSVSADDAAYPILAYDFNNHIDKEISAVNYKDWVNHRAEEISKIQESKTKATLTIKQEWTRLENNTQLQVFSGKSVSPLIHAKWNQDNLYNALSPADINGPGGHAYAGCVATAMSMVMYYWRYPLQGEGSHGYSWSPYGYIFADFGSTVYNWEQMMDVMDPAYEDVSLIQFHCGVGVDMMYSASGSGAYSSDVPSAIKNYFGYSQDAHFFEKEDYSQDDWADLLKAQIKESQPMFYSGFSSGGGHAFVCDGYDDNNYFHFNFGWGGSSNGYFSLYEVGGFNSGQGAVVNFIPGDNYPYYFTGQQVLNAKSGSFEDGSGPKEDYLADSDISWLIDPQQPEDSVSSITLAFSRFNLAESDEITVYDGESATANVLAVFSGTEIPAMVSSTGNKMFVVFKSNGPETANGFLASYTTERPVWCSGLTQMNEPEGELDDGSLTFDYYNNTVCMWRIEPENVGATTIYFTAFDTEPGNDVVKIFDLSTQELIAEYSGNYNGGVPGPVTSYSGQMFVTFSTNKDEVRAGWEAYYVTSMVGMDDVSDEINEVTIFPNPATNEINIDLSAFKNAEL